MEKIKMKKSIISTLLIFAVLAFLVSCGGSEGSSEGKVCESCGIYGHVTDYETGEDVANASVQLRPGGDTTLTGSDGMFEFRDLPSGEYSITVSKAGYSDLVDDYVITVRDRMVRRDVLIKKIKEKVPPEVRTLPVTASSTGNRYSNIFHAEVTAVGDPAYTERGFCYSRSSNKPDANDDGIYGTICDLVTGKGVEGEYDYTISEDPNDCSLDDWDALDDDCKIYYVRAYLKWNGSYIYGNTVSFIWGE